MRSALRKRNWSPCGANCKTCLGFQITSVIVLRPRVQMLENKIITSNPFKNVPKKCLVRTGLSKTMSLKINLLRVRPWARRTIALIRRRCRTKLDLHTTPNHSNNRTIQRNPRKYQTLCVASRKLCKSKLQKYRGTRRGRT